MEEKDMRKRRRLDSLEPTTVVQAMFAKKYVSHLVPALMRINKRKYLEDENGDSDDLKKVVRYQVDMALVMSAPGFAWSQALKDKLHGNINATGRYYKSSTLHHPQPSLKCHYSMYNLSRHPRTSKNKACFGTPTRPLAPCNAEFEMKCSPNTNGKAKNNKLKRPRRSLLKTRRTKKEAAKGSEEERLGSRLTSLRSLLPGGNEMGVDKLFSEMGSYIICLEFQVNILRRLVSTR